MYDCQYNIIYTCICWEHPFETKVGPLYSVVVVKISFHVHPLLVHITLAVHMHFTLWSSMNLYQLYNDVYMHCPIVIPIHMYNVLYVQYTVCTIICMYTIK